MFERFTTIRKKFVATVPEFPQSKSELFFLIIFALIWGKVPLKKIKSGFSLEKTWLIFRDEMIYSGLISLQTSEFLPDEILAMLLTYEGYLLAILTVYNMTWIDFLY